MRPRFLFVYCCLLGILATGCTPFQTPIPVRLEAKDQKGVDDAWNNFLTPVNRYNSQELLDILVHTAAYEFGVDRMEFRSEKDFSGGKVIMRGYFDRRTPEKDRFEVEIVDPQGKRIRNEQYTKEHVELSRRLSEDTRQLREKRAAGTAQPGELKKLVELEGRMEKVDVVIAAFGHGQKAGENALP